MSEALELELQRTFAPCPTCGILVCVRRWTMAQGKQPGRWQELAIPESAVTDTKHTHEERT